MGGRYVGIDLHRRRSVIYTMDADGERLDCVRIANDPWVLLEQVAKAGPDAEVVIEATYGWYWAVDLLQDAGFSVHLAHPSGNDWGNRRVKNDERDARDLADLLRLGRLAEAWIAPPAIRELRELVRYRAKLVQLRSGLKAQVHAVMAKEGVLPASRSTCSGPAGNASSTRCNSPTRTRCASSRCAISSRSTTVKSPCWNARSTRSCATTTAIRPSKRSTEWAAPSPRSSSPRSATSAGSAPREALCSWAGLTPRHRESDTKVVRGGITKMGIRLVRWAALEAVSATRAAPDSRKTSSASPSGAARNKARVAVARKLLTLVYYGLRDGEIRCLRDNAAVAA